MVVCCLSSLNLFRRHLCRRSCYCTDGLSCAVCLSVCQEFAYDRFMNGAKFFKAGRELKQPIMSFGSLCPGRRVALIQLKWFLITTLTRFQLRYRTSTSMPVYDAGYHGHEVLPPVSDVDVEFRALPTTRRLQLVD